MIKLIASDMDGTLLDENSHVPPETYDLIRKLREHGVHFAASSGRRYDTLCEFFEPVRDQMDFVASNGSQVYCGGELVDREVYSHAAVRRLEAVGNMFDCLHLALFNRKYTFLLDDEAVYEREMDKDLPNAEHIHFAPGPEINIIKASFFCDTTEYVMDMAYVLARELGDIFVFAPSGKKWIDAMQVGVSKATGIYQVMDHYNIDASDVMAFGDAMNDYEILRLVGHSCAMGNGRYAVKQVAKRVIGTNVDHAVQQEMRKVLEASC